MQFVKMLRCYSKWIWRLRMIVLEIVGRSIEYTNSDTNVVRSGKCVRWSISRLRCIISCIYSNWHGRWLRTLHTSITCISIAMITIYVNIHTVPENFFIPTYSKDHSVLLYDMIRIAYIPENRHSFDMHHRV